MEQYILGVEWKTKQNTGERYAVLSTNDRPIPRVWPEPMFGCSIKHQYAARRTTCVYPTGIGPVLEWPGANLEHAHCKLCRYCYDCAKYIPESVGIGIDVVGRKTYRRSRYGWIKISPSGKKFFEEYK